MSRFNDISMTGVDTTKTQPSFKASGLRRLFVTLSDSAPSKWIEFFDQSRSFPRHSMWREATVQGKYIVVDCVPEELDGHVQDLKEDVSKANGEYRSWLAALEVAEKKRKEAEGAERTRIENLAKKIKF